MRAKFTNLLKKTNSFVENYNNLVMLIEKLEIIKIESFF